MSDRFYTFIISSAVLLTAVVSSIMIFFTRQYLRYLATYKEYIRRVKMTLAGRLWKYICINIGVRVSPILILGVATCLLFVRREVNADVFFFLIGSGILITVLWIYFDDQMNYKEIDFAFDLHDHIETLDRVSAGEIIEGLNHVKFVVPYVPGEPTDTIRMRATINEIARAALIPSIYCDHHFREITSYDDPMQYIRTKRDVVVDAFNLGHHEDYLQLVLNRLPATVSFEESVESYISNLFVDVIAPSLIRCCEEKIAYYELVMHDWNMRPSIRGKAKYFKAKNEHYINSVQEICNYSAIIYSALTSRER